MRNTLLLVFWLCSCVQAASQNTFNKIYNNEYIENGGASSYNVIGIDSKVYSFGTLADSDGMAIGVILNYNSDGELELSNKLDGAFDSLHVNIGRYGGAFLDNEDDAIVFPYLEWNQDQERIWNNAIAKFTPPEEVELIWHQQVDSMDYIFFALHPAEEGYYAVGQSIPDTSEFLSIEGAHGFLMKLDSLGNQEWVQFYDQSVEINYIDQNSQGEFILGSWDHSAEPFPISSEHLIIKTDALGNEQWRYTFGGLESQSSPPLFFNENDEVIVAAWKHDFDNSYFPLRFLKIKDFGNSFEVLSDIEFHGNTSHGKITYAVKESSIGEVYASGHIVYPHSNGIGIQPAGFLMKMNSDLDSLWLRHYNFYTYSSAVESIKDFNFTEDGGLVMVGESKESLNPDEANIPGLTHIWTLKVDEHGCLEPGCELVGAEEILVGLQDAMKVYPNPVQDVLNLQWSLPIDYNTQEFPNQKLIIINSLGQIVHTKNITRGYLLSNYPMNISTLPPGHYTLHWMSENKWLDSVKFIKE